MPVRETIAGLTLVVVLAACPAAALAQDEKLVRRVSTDMLEALLTDMSIPFKKTIGKGTNVFYYDYERNNFKLRLHYYDGKDLLIEAVFTDPLPLEAVNNWNVRSRFSRAFVLKQKNHATATLDYSLDCLGGVSEGTIRQFIRNFDNEVKSFSDYIQSLEVDEEAYTEVSPERLEKILDSLNIKSPKKTVGNQFTTYEFVRNGRTIVLTSFGGKDLMLSTQFAKIPLEAVNKYNLQRSFIRLVLYPGRGKPFTALEANLDCQGGCTDGILRNWLFVFDTEVAACAKYLKED